MNRKTNEEKELYQSVRSKLNQNIKDVIATMISKIERNWREDEMTIDDIVNEVSKLVCDSDNYKKLRRSLVMDIVNKNKQPMFGHSVEEAECDWETGPNQSPTSLNSSLGSSLNQCGYLILDIKDLQDTEKLLQSSSLQAQLHALNVFSQISSLEQLVTPSLWSSLESTLRNTLAHPVPIVTEFCLNIYVKMLSCSYPNVVKESYKSLLQFLSSCAVGERQNQGDISAHTKKIFLQVLIIINKFQQYIIRNWLRYPQNLIEEMINDTFQHMLKSLLTHETNYNLWKLMAIIDTKANWLKNWLHNSVTRRYVINSIRTHDGIIKKILSNIQPFNKEKYLNDNFYEICTSFYFIGRLLQYSEGRNLIWNTYLCSSLNVEVNDRWDYLMKCMWKFYSDNSNFSNTLTELLSQAVCCLWKDKRWKFENRVQFLQELILLLDNFKVNNFPKVMVMIKQVTKLICDISTILCAKNDMINMKIDKQLNDIVDYLVNFPNGEQYLYLQDTQDEILVNIMKIFRNILSTPYGVLWSKDTLIVPLLIQIFQTLQSREYQNLTPTPFGAASSNINKASVKEMDLKEIAKTIIVLLRSPLSAFMITEVDYLAENIDFLMEYFLEIYIDFSLLDSCIDFRSCLTAFIFYPSVEYFHRQNILFVLTKQIWQLSDIWCRDNYIDNQNFAQDNPVIDHLKIITTSPSVIKMLYLDEFSNSINAEKFWKVICLLSLEDVSITQDYIQFIGTSLLCSLVCNIKTGLFLQEKLKIKNFLFKCLADNTYNGNVIIDEFSLLWNHILVRLCIIGGPNEKKLPPKELSSDSIDYKWPFVISDSNLESYWRLAPRSNNQTAVPLLQSNIENHLSFYQEIFVNHLKCTKSMEWQQLSLILEEVVKYIPTNNFNIEICCKTACSLSRNEKYGVELAIAYGNHLNLFDSSIDHCDLESMLKLSKISVKNHKCTSQFDIFITTIFLLLKGNQTTCHNLIKFYIQSKACIFNWIIPNEEIIKHNNNLKLSHAILSQHFEVILQENLSDVFAAFRMSGIPPSLMLWHWTSQCFWNYLDWIEICHWLLLTVMFGGDHVLYFSIAILKHLEEDILKNTQTNTLLDYLKETSIIGFRICDHFNFICELANRYHDRIEESVQKCIGK